MRSIAIHRKEDGGNFGGEEEDGKVALRAVIFPDFL